MDVPADLLATWHRTIDEFTRRSATEKIDLTAAGLGLADRVRVLEEQLAAALALSRDAIAARVEAEVDKLEAEKKQALEDLATARTDLEESVTAAETAEQRVAELEGPAKQGEVLIPLFADLIETLDRGHRWTRMPELRDALREAGIWVSPVTQPSLLGVA